MLGLSPPLAHLSTEPRDQLKLSLSALLLKKNKFPSFIWMHQWGKPVPFFVTQCKWQDEKSALIHLEDVNSEQEANKLKNETCFVSEADYETFFEAHPSYDYLLDLAVVDKTDGQLGFIVEVLENDNGHDTLVVQHPKGEILIPFVDEMIIEIDEENPVAQIESILANFDTYIPLIEKNYEVVKNFHNWDNRVTQIENFILNSK